ncbi:MAG: hypothetical protein ACYC1A_05095 [Spirochaetales bacterium]|jgi:hypothetical protein
MDNINIMLTLWDYSINIDIVLIFHPPFDPKGHSMNRLLAVLFPEKADATIRGSKLPFWVFVMIASIGTVRSFIHILSPDGGAGSIAGMDLSTAGASGVVLAFALWGSAQLIYALIQWLVILRYRSLVPFMWAVQIVETLLRMLVGHMKPVTFAHTPPGALQNYVYLPLAALMLTLSLWSGFKSQGKQK